MMYLCVRQRVCALFETISCPYVVGMRYYVFVSLSLRGMRTSISAKDERCLRQIQSFSFCVGVGTPSNVTLHALTRLCFI